VVWGVAPPITKLISAPPLIGTFFRFGLSSPFLLLVLAARGRMLSRHVFLATALPGLSFGINLIFVFATLQEATVSVLSTVVAMQPALLLVLAGPLFREYPTRRQFVFTLLGVVGAVGVILGAGSELRSSWLGVGLSALSLVTFSLYFILTRLARLDNESTRLNGWLVSTFGLSHRQFHRSCCWLTDLIGVSSGDVTGYGFQ